MVKTLSASCGGRGRPLGVRLPSRAPPSAETVLFVRGGLLGHLDHHGITLNYGYAIDHFGPASIWTRLVAGGGQLIVALVIANWGPGCWPVTPPVGRLMTSTYGWFVVFISLGDNAPGAVGRRHRLRLPASPSVTGRALDGRTAADGGGLALA